MSLFSFGRKKKNKEREVTKMAEFENLKRKTEELLQRVKPGGVEALKERTAPVLVAKAEELRKSKATVTAREREVSLREKSAIAQEQAIEKSVENLEKVRQALEEQEAKVKKCEDVMTAREEAVVKQEENLNKHDGELKAESDELDERKKLLDQAVDNQVQIDEQLRAREKIVKDQESEVAQVRALAGVLKRIIDELQLQPELERRGILDEFTKYMEVNNV